MAQDPETGIIYHVETKPPYKLDEEGNKIEEKDEEGSPTGKFVMDEEIMARLEQRADDTEEALTKRLDGFAKNREAVASCFKSIAMEVDGNRAMHAIFADIEAFLDK